MRARVGDLAIVRFDPGKKDIALEKTWDEKVCIVTGTYQQTVRPREYKVIHWAITNKKIEIWQSSIPSSRLIRARPLLDIWEGTLATLTIDDVEEVI